jgi:hypothetical protein
LLQKRIEDVMLFMLTLLRSEYDCPGDTQRMWSKQLSRGYGL